MSVTAEVAFSIINTAKEHGIRQADMPEAEKDRISQAEEYIAMARTTVNKSAPVVQAILALADAAEEVSSEAAQPQAEPEAGAVDAPAEAGDCPAQEPGGGSAAEEPHAERSDVQQPPADAGDDAGGGDDPPAAPAPDAGVDASGEAAQPTGEGEAPDAEAAPSDPEDPGYGSFRDVIAGTKQRLKDLDIPEPEIPDELRGKLMPYPHNITEMPDEDWRRMHWERHVMSVYTAAQLTDAEEEADGMDRLAKHRFDVRLGEIEKLALDNKQDRAITAMKAEAAEDAEYRTLLGQAQAARHLARKLKQINDGFNKDCERLSREWTARHGSREMGRPA